MDLDDESHSYQKINADYLTVRVCEQSQYKFYVAKPCTKYF